MIIQGQFRNTDNEIINVVINNSLGNDTMTIGEDGLFFGETPVEIETECDDVFEVILSKSCKISLVTKDYFGTNFFASNSREISVNITDNQNNCLFYGFVEPNSYNQSFAKRLEEFELNCTDVLGTLEFFKYKDAKISTYETLVQNSDIVTIKDILINCLKVGNTIPNIYFDNSKGLTANNESHLFEQLKLSELIFFEKEFKKMWDKAEVVEDILKYLNLHIIQNGRDFYLFDWDNLKNYQSSRNWTNIIDGSTITTTSNLIELTGADHAEDDTNISIGEVVNQINVKCETTQVENIISSPLEKNNLDSLFAGKFHYMREYISEGDGERSARGMWQMLNNQPNTYANANYIDWWLHPMFNTKWKFHIANGQGDLTDIYEKNGETAINAYKVAKYVKDHTHTAGIFAIGSNKTDAAISDDAPKGKLSLSNFMIISINGNNDITNNPYPTATELQANTPLIEYVGDSGGLTLSPNDDETTNYIVFSGQMCLQPKMLQSGYYSQMVGMSESQIANVPIVPSKNDQRGRRYTIKYFKNENPKDDNENQYLQNEFNLQMDTEDKTQWPQHQLKYNYSVLPNHREDYVKKLPILECELIIGNKRLIETDVQEDGSSVFQWVQIGNEPTYEYDGETYTLTTFTLGVNPKIDDQIIGTTFDIQNTIKIQDNINTEGTAIPITKTDQLSGKMTFKILGVINTTWNNVTRRHPTWFRRTRYQTNDVPILPLCESLLIKDFNCKLYSDNGGNSTTNVKDLLYQSAENENAYKTKEVTFNIITQPTATDKINLSINDGIYLNAMANSNGTPISTIYNSVTEETAKPELHYIDYYFRECTTPKLEMETTLHNDVTGWQNLYYSDNLEKTFFTLKQVENLKQKTTTITIREI